MPQDEMKIEILEDGTIKVSTSKVSAANHMNADKFIAEMQRLCGGTTSKEKIGHAHHHQHTHEHAKEGN